MIADPEQIAAALRSSRALLLAELSPDGRWDGELSSSALATAIASFALGLAGRTLSAERGLEWLRLHRNADGSWGDSPESPGNFTATLLCRCALQEETGTPEETAQSILDAYGNDRTFSAPILAMALLSGRLGSDWTLLPQLPFELAAVPHRFYKWIRLPVVSYALPALIAVGLLRHIQRPARFSFFRNLLVPKVLEILHRIQPESGGFLEAAPLTGFVAMCLTGAGFRDHPVTQACLHFLQDTVRRDGSWPIDVNLSTWLTSLAVRALGNALPEECKAPLREHLLKTQWKKEHPFTHAAPGGWGWTDSQGGVPDADDTAAALLALHALGCDPAPAEQGIRWLLGLQNRDGGMPTFCKGRGHLPFDRSCPDLTAHAIRACAAWRDRMPPRLQKKADRLIRRSLRYLQAEQQPDGAWIPLWFGSQHRADSANPVYGTVRVLQALRALDQSEFPSAGPMEARGIRWLKSNRNPDGSWGHSIEESALASGITGQGLERLMEQTLNGTVFPAAPIGLYFAKLWYSEKLYPLLFTVEALHCGRSAAGRRSETAGLRLESEKLSAPRLRAR
jgi:squalene-hopene/tetraprenyl-beta-curcumene cyclase